MREAPSSSLAPDELGSDGPTNLLAAVRAAADDRLDAGVVVAVD